MLFGRMVYGQAQAAARIGKLIGEVLDELGLRGAVLRVGLEYQVGIAGKRLPPSSARSSAWRAALLKRPHYLIVNEAVSLIDTVGQARILANLLKASEGRTVHVGAAPSPGRGGLQAPHRHEGRPHRRAGAAEGASGPQGQGSRGNGRAMMRAPDDC